MKLLISIVFDMCAAQNLMQKDSGEENKLRSLQVNKLLSLEKKTEHKVKVVKTVRLGVQISDSKVRDVLGVVRSLLVRVSLGPFFIDQFVKGGSLMNRK